MDELHSQFRQIGEIISFPFVSFFADLPDHNRRRLRGRPVVIDKFATGFVFEVGRKRLGDYICTIAGRFFIETACMTQDFSKRYATLRSAPPLRIK